MADLLFEIGTEEIPAGFLGRAIAETPALATDRLKALRLEHGAVTVYGAPRRLALSVEGLADRQPDLSETVTGPPEAQAFKDGKPTKAAEGFAAKNGVTVADLTIVNGRVVAQRAQKGEATRALLPKFLVELARAIPWKKSMRWASFDETFVRPVHWIVALFGGEVVPLEAYGVKAGRESRGHRFLAPGPIALAGTLDDYQKQLRAAHVIVDPVRRRLEIEAELARVPVKIRPDEALVAEVTNLVEYPQAIVGSFDEKHLRIPAEVIVTAMRAHQRYFACERPGGGLDNKFVTIAGTLVTDAAVVSHGNERVLAARLADAAFFHDEDRKHKLIELRTKLDGVVFQAKLGTIGEKVARVGARAALAADQDKFARAAELMKADLVTKMVGEFPELQGVMGRYYAGLDGESPDVADAILEHYLPRGASDGLPKGDLGAALGIADRMDTIVGCWSVGLAPTGSADAFGLRRNALAVINILIDRGWRVRLGELIDAAATQLASKIKWTPELRAAILEFFQTRLRGLLVEQKGLAADCVDAALAAGFEDVPDALERATAVSHLRDRPDFEPLGVAFKRVGNILKKFGTPETSVSPSLFTDASEKALWERFVAARGGIESAVAARKFDAALTELANLRPAVDKFFDDVLVDHQDAAVKTNRLALLGAINQAFVKIADFKQLAVK